MVPGIVWSLQDLNLRPTDSYHYSFRYQQNALLFSDTRCLFFILPNCCLWSGLYLNHIEILQDGVLLDLNYLPSTACFQFQLRFLLYSLYTHTLRVCPENQALLIRIWLGISIFDCTVLRYTRLSWQPNYSLHRIREVLLSEFPLRHTIFY